MPLIMRVKSTKRLLFALALVATLFSIQMVETHAGTPEKPIYPSLVQLIVNPEQYEGKVVSVIGFLSMEREGDVLFFHEEDATNVILQNAIRVQETAQMHRDAEKLHLKYVKLSGIFHAGDRKKIPFYSGIITDVRSCDLWSDPQYPMNQKIHDLLKAH